ncbi:MAG: hypothetical protein ACR2PF_19745 [Rhizobiaceae bacterium]
MTEFDFEASFRESLRFYAYGDAEPSKAAKQLQANSLSQALGVEVLHAANFTDEIAGLSKSSSPWEIGEMETDLRKLINAIFG